jgi:hypothetical protein
LTPQRIEPEKAQFVNSPLNLQICRNHAPSTHFSDLDLEPWVESIAQAVQTGAAYSLGFPITPPDRCNHWGQRYYGPVVLITDALCYSATDMFAAGFQDHQVGYLLGASANTGAGGANVWSHAILRDLMESGGGPDAIPSPYAPLPHGADIRVAVRRTLRVRENAGVVLEDLGVPPPAVHPMTRDDLLKQNVDLLDQAGEWLASQKAHPIEVIYEPQAGALPRLRVKTGDIDRLDIAFGGRPVRSANVQGDAIVLDLQDIAGSLDGLGRDFELRGYAEGKLVAAYRDDLDRSRRTVRQL